MSFKRPYDNWQTYTPQPETQRREAPGWLSPFNIALTALGIGLSLIPGLQEVIPQIIIGEALSATQTGVMYGVGAQPSAFQTGLSFGLPIVFGRTAYSSNLKALEKINASTTQLGIKNLISGIDNQGIKPNIFDISSYPTIRAQRDIETSLANVKSALKWEYSPLQIAPDRFLNRKFVRPLQLSNKESALLQDFNTNKFEMDLTKEQENQWFSLMDRQNRIDIYTQFEQRLTIVSGAALERTSDLADTMRQFNVPQQTIEQILTIFDLVETKFVDEGFRNLQIIDILRYLDIENEFAQGLKNTIAALYEKMIKASATINVERIFVRAWRDMLYTSPKRFFTRYGFESPLLKLRYETKATSWENIQKMLKSQNIKRLRQGARFLNPTMVSRSAVNFFARKMTRYVNNLIKDLKKFKQGMENSTDRSGIDGMNQENSILRTSKNLAADAFKRLKAGEQIALPSAWLLSLRIIEDLLEESLCMITFQQIPTKNKEPVLVWANDKQLLELLDRPGNTYLDYFATSRGGKLVSLGSMLGMRGSIIPPSILHAIGVGLPTQSLRNLISIASNVKKAVDGNYLKKWQDPKKYLFQNFYLYGVSRGSRLIGRTMMGGMINHILGGKLSSAITGKLGKQLDHSLTHLIPMEGQRLMTTFASTPIRNLLSGKSATSGMKRAIEINSARVFRDHTRFYASQVNPNLGTLKTIQYGRYANLYGRGASIFAGNKWKKAKW